MPTFVRFKPPWQTECVLFGSLLQLLLGQDTKALPASGNRSKTIGRESGRCVDAVRHVVKRWEQAADLSPCQPTQTPLLLLYRYCSLQLLNYKYSHLFLVSNKFCMNHTHSSNIWKGLSIKGRFKKCFNRTWYVLFMLERWASRRKGLVILSH